MKLLSRAVPRQITQVEASSDSEHFGLPVNKSSDANIVKHLRDMKLEVDSEVSEISRQIESMRMKLIE